MTDSDLVPEPRPGIRCGTPPGGAGAGQRRCPRVRPHRGDPRTARPRLPDRRDRRFVDGRARRRVRGGRTARRIRRLGKVIDSARDPAAAGSVDHRGRRAAGRENPGRGARHSRRRHHRAIADPLHRGGTDLLAGKSVWLQRGPVDEAIRASIAIPGVIAPHVIDGRLLADGGILDPLPMAPIAAVNADLTIAVSLSGSETAAPTPSPNPGPRPSG